MYVIVVVNVVLHGEIHFYIVKYGIIISSKFSFIVLDN